MNFRNQTEPSVDYNITADKEVSPKIVPEITEMI